MSEDARATNPVESHPSDISNDKPGSLWFLWSVVALLLAYPLSLGPVALAYKTKRPPNFISDMYEPLEYVYHRSALAHNAIDWYLHVWGVR
jgi:hypothetical protein